MRRRWLVASTAVLVVICLAASDPALAHSGLIGRRDLPIPTWLFGWGAAVVLVISFAALALLWPDPRLQEPGRRRLIRLPAAVDILCGAIGIGLFAVVVYAGLTGSQKPTQNLAPTFVYVIFWVGLVVVSVLLGDVFRALNPWRAVARAVAWLAGRVSSSGLPEPLPYPQRLGRWPAVVGIMAFAWLELAYVERNDPSTIAVLALGYAAVQLAGMSVYGIDRWTDRADGLSVYFGLFARAAPLERRDRVVYLRTPLAGLAGLELLPGTVTLLCVMIGSTGFDGFSNSTMWSSLAPDLRQPVADLGIGPLTTETIIHTVGLIASVVLVAGIYRAGLAGMRTVGEGHTGRELAGRFGYTLIPIAFAYVLAHYFSLLIYQGQAGPRLLSNALDGAAVTPRIDFDVIRATGVWYVQVGVLVVGHAAGLMLAHDRALTIYERARDAVRSQGWMLVVMVGFTSLGLWLLASAQQ